MTLRAADLRTSPQILSQGLGYELRPLFCEPLIKVILHHIRSKKLLGAKGIATRNKGRTTSNKKLVETIISK